MHRPEQPVAGISPATAHFERLLLSGETKNHSAYPNDLAREFDAHHGEPRSQPVRFGNIVRNPCTACDMGPIMTGRANGMIGFVQDEIVVNVGDDSAVAYLVRGDTGAEGDFCAMLLAMMSHDLRQPLQIIMAANDALELRLAGQPERRQLERVARATTRISDKLELLADALRLRESTGRTELEPVSLDAVLGELIEELGDRARQKRIELRAAGARARVLSQSALLSGMLRNLMRNAIEYTPTDGRVFVGCRRRGAMVRIEVRDNGPGIADQELESVFRAFQRGATTRPGGLGLGLFIVKRAADFLGHRLELRSAPGRGSCFAVIADADASSRNHRFHSAQVSG